jgi:UDP-GlcNAc:undecaprenyl-phosphate GlcNAc-1-phosphate transferase
LSQQYPFVALFAVAFGATVLSMPVARRIGARIGLLDHPDERKLQASAVPRTGGIGILCGLTAGSWLLVELSGQLGIPVTREILAIFAGAILLHVTGVLDDLFDIPARVKLVAQVVAAAIPVQQGLVVDRLLLPGDVTLHLGLMAAPLTVFLVVGFINAINLVDGLDGLASGVAAIGALALAIAGVLRGNAMLAAPATTSSWRAKRLQRGTACRLAPSPRRNRFQAATRWRCA